MSEDTKAGRGDALRALFPVAKPIIGMIHAMPTPGSPRGRHCDVAAVYDHGVEEARRLLDGGVDGILIENAGDVPFQRPEKIGHETIAVMAVLGRKIFEAVAVPVGFNIVANAAMASIACAKAAGARFVRVNQWANAYVANEGLIEGAAADALRYRARIDADDVVVFADAHVKHGAHAIVADRPIVEQARDVAFFQADVAVATGLRTGDSAELAEIEQVREGSRLPTIVGSGVNPDNAAEILAVADGAIVGVSFKDSGEMWATTNIDRVRRLMDTVVALR
ncbi:MAG: BtpA/SgcQ family protein [Hyphomicrobiales bacterium]|nr:BtpA/SgcQ family protein [Hyphomicrobiales bacterium]